MSRAIVKKEAKRYALVIFGAFLFSVGMNCFIVPLNLYSSGVLGIAQIIRTLLQQSAGLHFQMDIAGVLNFVFNLPLFFIAYKTMSKNFFVKTLLSVIVQTVFMTFLPIPAEPILEDMLANCIIGGVMGGIGMGLTLQCSGCGGGMDILGVYFTKKFENFSVGKLSLLINAVLYLLCAVLFDLEIAIYSILFLACLTLVTDRAHYQNINVTCMVFSKAKDIEGAIMEEMGRGVTVWDGMGAYTSEHTRIMTVVINKYEVNHLKAIVKSRDARAFLIFFEGTHVSGNFEKRL